MYDRTGVVEPIWAPRSQTLAAPSRGRILANRCATVPGVKQIASGRIGQVATKYADQAPMATVCCNACRTCVTTNIVGVVMAAAAASDVGIRRLFRRPADAA
jgi:hypothetical protein